MPPAPSRCEETEIPLTPRNFVGAGLLAIARYAVYLNHRDVWDRQQAGSYRDGVMPQMTVHPAMRDNAGQFQE